MYCQKYVCVIMILSLSVPQVIDWGTPILPEINSLWPSDAIWQHLYGSTLAQVMACCLMAPSHYLNQCWLIFSKFQWHPLEGNCTKIAQLLIIKIILKINNLTFHSNIPGDNELTEIRAWISNHICCFLWYALTYPYPNLNSVDTLLKLGHTIICMWM